MAKSFLNCLFLIFIMGCFLISACGGGKTENASISSTDASQTAPKDMEKIKRLVEERVKQAEKRTKDLDGQAAYDMASQEAKKWDANARLYYLKGEEGLTSKGTAKQWTVNFALREDSQNSPSRDHGKKFVVLILGGRIMQAEKKESPEDISYTSPCYAFLPENWMSAQEAYTQCLDALKDEYGSGAARASSKRIECFTGQYYQPPEWKLIPNWRLTMEMEGKPISAAIHAESGKVLEIK